MGVGAQGPVRHTGSVCCEVLKKVAIKKPTLIGKKVSMVRA